MELKPCPFCGSIDGLNVYVKGFWFVQCDICGCRGPDNQMTKERATEAWNNRTTETAKHGHWEKAKYIEAPVYVCSECGNREPLRRNYCPECGCETEG